MITNSLWPFRERLCCWASPGNLSSLWSRYEYLNGVLMENDMLLLGLFLHDSPRLSSELFHFLDTHVWWNSVHYVASGIHHILTWIWTSKILVISWELTGWLQSKSWCDHRLITFSSVALGWSILLSVLPYRGKVLVWLPDLSHPPSFFDLILI